MADYSNLDPLEFMRATQLHGPQQDPAQAAAAPQAAAPQTQPMPAVGAGQSRIPSQGFFGPAHQQLMAALAGGGAQGPIAAAGGPGSFTPNTGVTTPRINWSPNGQNPFGNSVTPSTGTPGAGGLGTVTPGGPAGTVDAAGAFAPQTGVTTPRINWSPNGQNPFGNSVTPSQSIFS